MGGGTAHTGGGDANFHKICTIISAQPYPAELFSTFHSKIWDFLSNFCTFPGKFPNFLEKFGLREGGGEIPPEKLRLPLIGKIGTRVRLNEKIGTCIDGKWKKGTRVDGKWKNQDLPCLVSHIFLFLKFSAISTNDFFKKLAKNLILGPNLDQDIFHSQIGLHTKSLVGLLDVKNQKILMVGSMRTCVTKILDCCSCFSTTSDNQRGSTADWQSLLDLYCL